MGNVLSACCGGPSGGAATTESLSTGGALPARDKMRPLLTDLESDFNEFCGSDGKLDAKELADVWVKCAKRKFGSLTAEDEETIKSAAGIFQKQVDFDKSGFITFDELVLFMLGSPEERGRGPLEGMQEQLKKQKINISQVLAKFRKWDASGDGFLTPEELKLHAKDLQELCGVQGGSPDELVKKLMREADVDNDGKLDFYEILAHSLGRRKQAVELLVYDISKGVSARYSKYLLGKGFEAIYHTGVFVYGKEFWYGGNLFQTEAPCDKVFGPPLLTSTMGLQASKYNDNLMVVHLGYTLATRNEFLTFLVDEMKGKYTRENYDVLTHNCNCFSNDAVRFLTGADIPDQIRNLPALVMQTPTARMLRPFLNKWLGGFGGGADGGAKDVERIAPIEEEDPEAVIREVLGSGGVIDYDGKVATILRENGDLIDIKYYDPAKVQFVEEKGVRKTQCRRVSQTS
mmetsp:Transcript_55776/g.132954  ORF Transcript_55776/g.132954 Transcript_55776/m.132954 type:complete len:460 (-) Transcript_55776:58-1437(-)